MPFAYYSRLSSREKAIYRRSDEVTTLALPNPEALHPTVDALGLALSSDERRGVEAVASRLVLEIVERLGLPPVAVSVLAVRPSSSWGELHGLYTRGSRGPARIELWMRTARHHRVVAFRTFLRTLLHEVGHHVDYEHLRLGESFHTEGFFRRESSLFKQLVPAAAAPRAGQLPLPPESRPGGRK
ncbi:MAG TPA: hypothetical protein VMX54_14855 [Vicinamibacteria bacterium]|nr:hypothetical protein [Vicinamibacteria bacterium]